MKFKPLGTTGVRVSCIALGTATFGVAPQAAEAERMVGRALELGVNVFDCANSYGNQARFDRPGAPPVGQRDAAEEILGRALAGHRDEVILCSKVMEPVGPGENDHGLSRLHIFTQVERSLRRLQTDHIDIYYAHHPDPATPLAETLRAFDDLIRAGKIRYCALSTYLPSQMVEALWIAERFGMRPPVCNQVPYNLANREHERDLIPACLRHGMSLMAFSPLAGGLFGDPEGRTRRFAGHARWGGPRFDDAQLRLAAELQALAEQSSHTTSALALHWLLAQQTVAACIIGPETVAEMETAVAAADISLPESVLEAVDRIGKLEFAYY